LSLAALLGEDIYSFGELLSHPVVRAACVTTRHLAEGTGVADDHCVCVCVCVCELTALGTARRGRS